MSTNVSNIKETPSSVLPDLILGLSETDGMMRRKYRRRLERLGSKATPFLIEALATGDEKARWESAKALIHIKDPAAADALTTALMDESAEIQWLAAEALIELGQYAIKPILLKLLDHYESPDLRQGVHHVLSFLHKKNLVSEDIKRIIKELDFSVPKEPIPLAARKALKALDDNETATSTQLQSAQDEGEEILE